MNRGKVENLDFFGQGIVKENGKCIFVKNALPGETITYRLIKDYKKYAKACAVEILEPSPARLKPPCPYYGKCGGCQFQHVQSEVEARTKEQHLYQALQRLGGLDGVTVLPMADNPAIYGYRNKVTWQVKSGQTGFYQKSSREFLAIEHCLLLAETLNETTASFNDLGLKDVNKLMMRCNEQGETVISLATSEHSRALPIELLKLPQVVGVEIGGKSYGESTLTMTLGTKSLQVSPAGFFQVNLQEAEAMLAFAKETLMEQGISGGTVVDLYCGVGTAGLYFSDLFREVIGVESFPEAVALAKKNACNNGVTARFYGGKTEEVLATVKPYLPKAPVVVVDPPRSGLAKSAAMLLRTAKAPYILYISCDPATLSRDLKLLSGKYCPIIIKPFNLFPRTAHVETVALLAGNC